MKNRKRRRRKLKKLKKKQFFISLDQARDMFQLLVQQRPGGKNELLDFAEEFRSTCFSLNDPEAFIKKYEAHYNRLKDLKVFL